VIYCIIQSDDTDTGFFSPARIAIALESVHEILAKETVHIDNPLEMRSILHQEQ
jgi:hypothetical protein